MSTEPVFRLYGLAHLVVLGVTFGLPLVFWATMRGEGRAGWRLGVRYGLAALLIVNYAAYEVMRWMDGQFTVRDAAPMQLCDWAMVAAMGALLTLRMGWYEVAYFWGLSGTLQGVLTPNLQAGFPSLRFVSFFVAHCGIVVAVLYLTAVERLRPRAMSIVRAVLWSEVYFVSALVVNWVSGANYGFLAHRPAGHSLLDYLSDQHWLYLGQLSLLGVVFYLILYVPFFLRDLIRGETR